MSLMHALAAAALFVAPVSNETITNTTVIDLTVAGLGDEAIIAKINSSQVQFDLSTDQMIDLKKRGVSGPVIAAMLTASSRGTEVVNSMSLDSPDPMRAHPSGLYLFAEAGEESKMKRIDATVSNQAKTGGILGYALTGGIASMSVKASIQNETARVASGSRTPTFYFFFDESNGPAGTGTWASGTAAMVTSPSEFTLIRLNKKKGRREARVGSANIGGAKTGVMDKDRIAFDYALVRPGVYRVAAGASLEPGEYGFIYAISGGGAGGALTARIFDFSVR